MTKKDTSKYSLYLMQAAFICVGFSVIGYLGFDFWLASTQWLLVSIVLAMFGVYLKLK